MGSKVYKYLVGLRSSPGFIGIHDRIIMPEHAVIRSAGMQGEGLVVWAEVDDAYLGVQRSFAILGTGFELPFKPNEASFVATVIDGGLVWHLYDLGEA